MYQMPLLQSKVKVSPILIHLCPPSCPVAHNRPLPLYPTCTCHMPNPSSPHAATNWASTKNARHTAALVVFPSCTSHTMTQMSKATSAASRARRAKKTSCLTHISGHHFSHLQSHTVSRVRMGQLKYEHGTCIDKASTWIVKHSYISQSALTNAMSVSLLRSLLR